MTDNNKDVVTLAHPKPPAFEIKEETFKVIYRNGQRTGAFRGNGELELYSLTKLGFNELETALKPHV